MTDRLAQLLDDEAERLSVPTPPTEAILTRGTRQRRRRQAGLAAGAVAAATALVAAGGVLIGSPLGGQDPDVAATTESGAVFSVANTVYYDGAARSAPIDDKAVKSLLYTSAGVLVRHGDNASSDGGGPQRFSLVRADGTVTPLGLVTEETVHASDPDQPYVAYAENVDGQVEAVVYDVEKDEETARVRVADSGETWFPVSLDGERVYVQSGYEGGVFAVEWRTGAVAPAEGVPSASNIADGRAAGMVNGQPAVLEVASGEAILSVDGSGYFELSPDGEHAMLVPEDDGAGTGGGDAAVSVYDVESGTAIELSGTAWEWGWTADGDPFRVGETEVQTCSAETGECVSEPFDAPPAPEPSEVCEMDGGQEVCWEEGGGLETRLGGRSYES